MSVAELVGKFGELDVSGVSPVANDIAAKVSSEGVPSLEKNNLMADLKVRSVKLSRSRVPQAHHFVVDCKYTLVCS